MVRLRLDGSLATMSELGDASDGSGEREEDPTGTSRAKEDGETVTASNGN